MTASKSTTYLSFLSRVSGLNFHAMKATILIAVFALALSGCSGSSLNPVNPPTVEGSGALPFPAIPPSGGTITLEPGLYTCPTSIPTSTHIVGKGSIMGEEIFNIGQPLHKTTAIATVRIQCGPLTLRSVADVQISGVIFDFQGGPGLTLDSVTYSRFDMGVYNASGAGVTFITSDGNTMANDFQHLVAWNCAGGLLFKGGGNFVNTWNTFGNIQILKATDYGVNISSHTDTNQFQTLRVAFLASTARAGLLINDKGTVQDVDTGGNIFSAVMVDAIDPANFQGFGVLFNGYTMGNYVRVTFGIMPEDRKVMVVPGFTHTDTIDRLQEHI